MRMMVFLVAVVAIAAVMLFPGYAGAVQLTLEEIEALNDTVFANATEIVTYKYDYKFDLNATLEVLMDNETFEAGMTGNVSGVVDKVNKTMWMAMSIISMNETMNATPETREIEMEMYFINNTVYVKMYQGIQELPWMKAEIPEGEEEFWQSQDQLDLQMELLNVSKVELLEDEVVNGVDCYVLKIEPDHEELWEIVMNQMEIDLSDFDSQETETGNASGIPYIDLVNQTMMNLSTTVWIAKDRKFPMKTQMTMKKQMTVAFRIRSEDVPDTEEVFPLLTMTMDFEMETIFYDYNEPVSIELPEGAEGAFVIPTTELPG